MKKNKKSKHENSFLMGNYLKSWKFIKESRKFIYAIILVFFCFALIAFFLPVPESFADEIMKMIEEIVRKTEGMSQFSLIKYIFLNNMQSSFLGLVLGVFFGIFPVLFAAFNGYVLGFVALLAIEAEGGSVLWKLLPHGIFELPAVFISLGLGIKIGGLVFHSAKSGFFKNYLWEFARTFIFVVIPLLLIAAIIEGSLIILAK